MEVESRQARSHDMANISVAHKDKGMPFILAMLKAICIIFHLIDFSIYFKSLINTFFTFLFLIIITYILKKNCFY